MNARQIELVRSSWALVLPVRVVAARMFYRRLFEQAPQVRPLFKRDLDEQGTMLMATLNTVVGSLDRLPQVLPVAQQLAVRHVGYGVQPEHYDSVGEALLWTLREGLGDAATDETMAAWATAYGLLASAMKAAAYPSSTASAAAPPLSVTPAKAGPDPEWQAQALMQAGAG